MADRFGGPFPHALRSQVRSAEVEQVRTVLSTPEERIDFAAAKFAFDALVDPAADMKAAARELDRLTAFARQLAGHSPPDTAKLEAIRKLLYDSGSWNEHRPFAYDQTDPEGHRLQNKLLHNYLATRLGQCVSMPVLFLILADRLGLRVGLATTPGHVLLRYVDGAGRAFNLEATSAGLPSRDEWYRQNFPMRNPMEDVHEIVVQGFRRMYCGALSALPRGGRFRFGGDVAGYAGPGGGGGLGLSFRRNGSISFDFYTRHGGGFGANAGLGFGIDTNVQPEGWSQSHEVESSFGYGMFGGNLSYSRSGGLGGGAGAALGPRIGYTFSGGENNTLTVSTRGVC